MQQYDYISILGPTASGKTALALALSERYPIEIISVDSVSVYQGMDIGSAKPSREEREAVIHHLIDVCRLDEIYTVGRFVKDVERLIGEIKARGALPVLCGGTLMYVAAWRRGYQMVPEIDIAISEPLIATCDNKGIEYLYEQLEKEDPLMAKRLHIKDRQRIIRALSVKRATGKSLTSFWQDVEESRYVGRDFLICVDDRDKHRQVLRKRIDEMVANGFEQECIGLLETYGEEIHQHPALRSIGYKQIISQLLKKKTTNDVRELIAIATSQLMKKQMTWINSWENQLATRFPLYGSDGGIKNMLQSVVESIER